VFELKVLTVSKRIRVLLLYTILNIVNGDVSMRITYSYPVVVLFGKRTASNTVLGLEDKLRVLSIL
jgi:hypothetical protein